MFKYSIIVPIYNVEKFLDKCITSILYQSYSNFELILVDDGSSDNCPLICDKYKGTDPRVLVIHKDNGGLVSARKAGANISSGDYILNVDGDDFIEESYLETIDNALSFSRADVLTWGWTQFNKKSAIKICHKFGAHVYCEKDLKMLKDCFLYDNRLKGLETDSLLVSVWCKAVKKPLYIRAQSTVPNSISQGEDSVFTLALLSDCKSVHIIDYNGYYYRTNNNSMMCKIHTDDFDNLNRLKEALIDNNYCNYNQIKVAMFVRLVNLIKIRANYFSYRDFKTELMNNMSNINVKEYTSFVVKKKKITDLIKIKLIKNRRYFCLFVFFRLLRLLGR